MHIDQEETWSHPERPTWQAVVDEPTPLFSKPSDAGVYVWKAPGKQFSIHLHLDVVEKMRRELSLAARNSGNDISGILLGREGLSEREATVVVDGYQLVRDNSSEEPDLPLAKQQKLADLVASWRGGRGGQSAVGLLRFQTRGFLALAQEDLDIASCLFPQGDNIFLVLRSSPEPRGAFFFWESNQIRAEKSYQEFPFDSAALTETVRTRIDFNGFEVLEGQAQSLGTQRTRRFSVRGSWLTIGATWGLAAISTLWCMTPAKTSDQTHVVVTQAAQAAAPKKFKVAYHGQDIEINWDRKLPAAKAPTQGDPNSLLIASSANENSLGSNATAISDTQKQILGYIAEDFTTQEIAMILGTTPKAVELQKRDLKEKFGVASDAGLVRYAIKNGIVQP